MAVKDDEADDLAGYLSGRIVLPGLGGAFLVSAAGLLWAGSHGWVGGYLVLFYGGILGIGIGLALAFVVGAFTLGVVSLGGLFWLVLERVAIAVGPVFGWAAPVLVVLGVVLLPAPLRRFRALAAEQRRWNELKGGSVPP